MTTGRFLEDCPSVAHRAVAGALRYALIGDVAEGVIEDCEAANEMDFAQVAQTHFIDAAIAPAFDPGSPIRDCFPDDLSLFFREMAGANARRNAALTAQLNDIGMAFAEIGIQAVALKGAAELVDPWWPTPEHRYLSDLDLLISETALEAAVDLLVAKGANQADDDGPSDHHHLPPLLAPDWEAMIELHHEVGASPISMCLPATRVLDQARPIKIGISVPDAEARVTHMLLHAPRGGAGPIKGRLYLREIVNIWSATHQLGAENVSSIEDDLNQRVPETAAFPFVSLVDAILGSAARPSSKQARNALRNFGTPDTDRVRDSFAWISHYAWEALTDSEQRRRYIKKILSPGGIRELREFHARRRRMMR